MLIKFSIVICVAAVLVSSPNMALCAAKEVSPPLPPELLAPLSMQPPQPIFFMPSGGGGSTATHIFAIAGRSCPAGSHAYKGPEAKLAAKSGVIYCEFKSTILVITQRKDTDRCPPPYVVYKNDDPSVTPDTGIMWCQLPKPGDIPGLPPGAPNPGNVPPAIAPTPK